MPSGEPRAGFALSGKVPTKDIAQGLLYGGGFDQRGEERRLDTFANDGETDVAEGQKSCVFDGQRAPEFLREGYIRHPRAFTV